MRKSSQVSLVTLYQAWWPKTSKINSSTQWLLYFEGHYETVDKVEDTGAESEDEETEEQEDDDDQNEEVVYEVEYYENPDPEYDNYEYEDDGEGDTTGSGDYGSYYDYEYGVDSGVDYEDEYGYGNQVRSGHCQDVYSIIQTG